MPEMISIVVPCLNEEEVLRDTNRRLVAMLEQLPQKFEILYVDDGSTDRTPEILQELQRNDRANSRGALFAEFWPPDGHYRRTRTRVGRRGGDY